MISDLVFTWTGVLALLLAGAWYLSYSAARLDRLHAKVEGALHALDSALVRRAEASLEVATSGVLDPASALLLVDAAAQSLEGVTVAADEMLDTLAGGAASPGGRGSPDVVDLLAGRRFGPREQVETQLTQTLATVLRPEVVTHLRHPDDSVAGQLLDRVAATGTRVQLARRFHNDAVAEVRRVRRKRVVRWFRLAGRAWLPEPVDFADALPAALAPRQ